VAIIEIREASISFSLDVEDLGMVVGPFIEDFEVVVKYLVDIVCNFEEDNHIITVEGPLLPHLA